MKVDLISKSRTKELLKMTQKLIKVIYFISVFFICIQFFNCKHKKVDKISTNEATKANKVSDENVAYFYSSLEDTLELNKEIQIELQVFHVISDTIKNPKMNRKIGEACVLFSNNREADFYSELFKNKCDTVFAAVKRIPDTLRFSFNYIPSIIGENRFLVKFTEKNYVMHKNDSIRLVTNSFFWEQDFVVVE